MKFRAIGGPRWAVIVSVFFALMFAGAITHPVAAAQGDNHGQAKGHVEEHGTKGPSPKADDAHQRGAGDNHGAGEASSHRSQGTAGTVGPVTSPQPLSKADQNDGGANGGCPGGPYCSTRDGDPSMNGRGDGQATGKPCAGCVGKADNKNPAGQAPGGSDPNAGYECDTNQGVGQSNPAHTGCATNEADEADDSEDAPEGTTEGTGAATETDCAGAGVGCTTGAEAAGQTPEESAEESVEESAELPNVVLGVEKERSQVHRATPQLQPQAAVLPNTGVADGLALWVAGGLALALAGATMLAMQRRRSLRR